MPETPRPLRPSLGGRPTSAAPLTPPAVGGVFGDFDLIARLGAGMHGTVWRARDRTTGDVIALKIMRADLAGDDAWARRFAREADLVSQLSHPSIPKIRRVGILGGRHFVAMDLIPGRTLDAVSRATGPMDLAQAVAILDHVGGALDAAHRRGIVHRDVKPANVIVVPGGRF